MRFKHYIDKVLMVETSKKPLTKEIERLGLSNRTFHSLLGIETKVRELQDSISKLDIEAISDNLGDILWYLAVFVDDNKVDVNVIQKAIEDSLNDKTVVFKFKSMEKIVFETLDRAKKTLYHNKRFVVDENIFARKIIVGVMSITYKSKELDIHKIMKASIKKTKIKKQKYLRGDNE